MFTEDEEPVEGSVRSSLKPEAFDQRVCGYDFDGKPRETFTAERTQAEKQTRRFEKRERRYAEVAALKATQEFDEFGDLLRAGDLTHAEGAIWSEFRWSVKALIQEIQRLR